jgi:peptide/nickel transport system substrate-binding protein
MTRRALRVLLGTVLAILPPLAAGSAAAEGAKDTLVIGMAQFPSSLHPDIDPETVKTYATYFALRPITAYDKDWHNTCLLCTELPSLDNGLAKIETRPDGTKGMAVTIKLKPDLKWGDGVPVTARDLLFTWKLGTNPASGFSNAHPWDRASSVDVVDDHTAVLHMKRVDVSFASWDEILPEHVEGPAAAKGGDAGAYLQNTIYNSAPTTAGLWNGPYLITGYESGQQIVFEPNPSWPGHKPYFKKITLKLVENTAALQANLLSGDVDMVAGEGIGLTIDQVLVLRKQHPEQFTYTFRPSLTYEHLDVQRDDPALGDVRVRRAMLMAADRDTMVKRLFEGMQPVATTWVNPLDPNYDGSIPTVSYDTAGARALLAEAGWRPGSDGVCRDKDGHRLSVVLTTTAGNRLRELQEQVLQSQWKAACIEATIKNEPARTLFGDTLKHRTYTGLAMYAWSSDVNESPRRTLGTDNIPTAANNWSGSNYTAFSDPKMDADITAAESELDPGKRKAIWADMQRIYAEQLPVLPLFFRADAHVTPTWLTGYSPTGNADLTPLWAEDWGSSQP